MPDSQQFDVRELPSLALPYDKTTRELSEAPLRLIAGENIWITRGGKPSRRPGTNDTGLTALTVDKRPDRLLIYETVEASPKIFLLASFYNSSSTKWELWYCRPGTTGWTTAGTLRDINVSERPHEMVQAAGKVYVKAFPGAAADKYGSVVFDGTGGSVSVKPWGIPGPAVAARMHAPGSWAASSNSVTVNLGWKYVYCYVSSTGQYSNRSPLETDPAQEASDTGAFTDKKPEVDVQGDADTTNLPYIAIFRTTDGGGTFYFVEQIANTGAGTITFTDHHRVAGNTNDPMMDSQLDTTNIAPSRVSNTVPPPVGPSGTIGTTQVAASSPLAYYAHRIWYAIGNRLYCSGYEETLNGITFESFPNPNGIRGNYWILRDQVRLLAATKNALYVLTTSEILVVRGTNRAEFVMRRVENVGAAAGHPRAVAVHGSAVFFLSDDMQIGMIYNDQPAVFLDAPLDDEITSRVGTNKEIVLECYSRRGNTWLVVACVDKATSANTVVLTFDMARSAWNVPWTIRVGAMAFGRFQESDATRRLAVLSWVTSAGALSKLDEDTFTDAPSAGTYAFSMEIVGIRNPGGNHINLLRQPALIPQIDYIQTERTKFSGDTDPTVAYRLDELSGSYTTVAGDAPPYLSQSASYVTYWHPIGLACRRIGVKISRTADNKAFELQNLGLVFQPEAGV